MNIDSIVELAKEVNTQIPLLIKVITWWKTIAIIAIIVAIIEALYIISTFVTNNSIPKNESNK